MVKGNLRDIAKPSVIITLQENLAAEIENRIAADEVLQSNIEAEEQARIDADEILREELNAAASEIWTELDTKNSSPTLWVGDTPLYGSTFVDMTDDGIPVIREDGSGDYLIHVTVLNEPLLRYMGKVIGDTVTESKYIFTIENGSVFLEQVG